MDPLHPFAQSNPDAPFGLADGVPWWLLIIAGLAAWHYRHKIVSFFKKPQNPVPIQLPEVEVEETTTLYTTVDLNLLDEILPNAPDSFKASCIREGQTIGQAVQGWIERLESDLALREEE